MNYYLFIDESGDQNLANFNPDFPVFTLCGAVMNEDTYMLLDKNIRELKNEFWEGKRIVFHSRDIRKCEKGFEKLFDLEIKKRFYDVINSIVENTEYSIIASSIQKEKFIQQFGRLEDVYGIALSSIIERTVQMLDEEQKKIAPEKIELHVIVEKRGKREDTLLINHYNKLFDIGTFYVQPERIKTYFKSFRFESKSENIHGLEFADLLAYPISRYVIDSGYANPAF